MSVQRRQQQHPQNAPNVFMSTKVVCVHVARNAMVGRRMHSTIFLVLLNSQLMQMKTPKTIELELTRQSEQRWYAHYHEVVVHKQPAGSCKLSPKDSLYNWMQAQRGFHDKVEGLREVV